MRRAEPSNASCRRFCSVCTGAGKKKKLVRKKSVFLGKVRALGDLRLLLGGCFFKALLTVYLVARDRPSHLQLIDQYC